jgi:hypothetical protein
LGLGAVIMPFLCGCSATTLNKRCAYADAGAVVATGLALDAVNDASFDAVQAKTIQAATFIKSLVSLPEMSELPVSVVKEKVVTAAKGSNTKDLMTVLSVADIVFGYVTQHLGTLDKIGTEGCIMLNAACDGCARQASRMKKEWR